MKKSRSTDEEIAFALKQAESGTPVDEVCRKIGISQQTFYRWKKKFASELHLTARARFHLKWAQVFHHTSDRLA